ncbi:DUF72 domain-containing protein [Mucilaginibacter gossypiicola]|nr:DUF72 domain-containing protein [Mucilaginibacter gossypiicola]
MRKFRLAFGSFKLWKEITRQKNLLFSLAALTEFMNAISPAKKRQGTLLIKFPPGVNYQASAQLDELLGMLTSTDWPLGGEFRLPSWHNGHTYELLNRYQACSVLQDVPASAFPTELKVDN